MLMEMSLTLLLAAKVILLFVYKIQCQYTTNHDRYCGIDCICNINGSLKLNTNTEDEFADYLREYYIASFRVLL